MIQKCLTLVSCLLFVGVVAAQEKGTVVTLDGLSSAAPKDWKSVQAAGQFRHAEFVLPGEAGNAELIVFYFGPGGGGGPEANIARWKGMFRDADARTEQFTVEGVKVTYLDISGTYLLRKRSFDPQEQPQPQPGSRMFAIVFESANGPYYIRLVGPEKTVAQHKPAFDQWLRGFKRPATE
jgi:hypothetical protein